MLSGNIVETCAYTISLFPYLSIYSFIHSSIHPSIHPFIHSFMPYPENTIITIIRSICWRKEISLFVIGKNTVTESIQNTDGDSYRERAESGRRKRHDVIIDKQPIILDIPCIFEVLQEVLSVKSNYQQLLNEISISHLLNSSLLHQRRNGILYSSTCFSQKGSAHRSFQIQRC